MSASFLVRKGTVMSIITRGFLSAMLILFAAQVAFAGPGDSYRKNKKKDTPPPAAPAQKLDGVGTIEGVAAGALKVNVNGMQGVVQPGPKCRIEVTGLAEPGFLRPGMLVRFNAEVGKNGRTTAPLNTLEIVTMKRAMEEAAMAAQAKKAENAEPETEMILAKIGSVKNKYLTLTTTAGESITAELGANPSISVNVDDYSVASPGDKVEVNATIAPQGYAVATKIVIKLARPLGEGLRKPLAKPAEKTTASAKEKG
jgi:hypothetical protein